VTVDALVVVVLRSFAVTLGAAGEAVERLVTLRERAGREHLRPRSARSEERDGDAPDTRDHESAR
jgi:hypothetical protein